MSAMIAVHPRVRGEHSLLDPLDAQLAGPSPRARGTRCHLAIVALRDRSIPACAGNTSRW